MFASIAASGVTRSVTAMSKALQNEIKAGKAPASGMFVIEINMTTSSFKN